jgi:hypothetical protein
MLLRWRPRRAGVAAALALGVVAGLGFAAAPALAQSAPVPGPVVLIGTGGVRWSALGTGTPHLRAFLGDGAVGVQSVRSVRRSTCPVDGWLAVSAGARAADEAGPCRTPAFATAPAEGTPASVARWDVYLRLAGASSEGAHPGLLGDTLAGASVPSAAVGPGAGIAVADAEGRIPAAWPGLPARADGSVDPSADPGDLTRQVTGALARRPGLLVVDVGAVRAAADVQEQLRAVDDRVGAVLAALPAGATALVASLADAGAQARLQLIAARGPAPGGEFAGYLRSGSTRQDGLVQSTDVLPTLTEALGLPTPDGAIGSPLTSTSPASTTAGRERRLADVAEPAETIDPIVTPFFLVVLIVQFLLYVGALVLRARRRAAGRPTARLDAIAAAAAVGFALVPAASFLANLWPWWRAGSPALALATVTLVAAAALAAVALLGPWRRRISGPAGVAGALTALVLTTDVATGSHLSLTALIGGQPLVGGRYYGLSNPGFALFATGALFAAVAIADPLLHAGRPRAAAAAVAALGVAATAVDVLPGLGSDFGGPLALVPAFAYLALRVGGVRLTWRRAIAVLLGTVGVLAVVAVGDWLRPPASRTHLGGFVQTVLDGGGWDVVSRKVEQNLGIVTSAPIQLLLPFIAVAVGVVLARPRRWRLEPLAVAYERSPALRPALGALAVLVVVGFAVNDSGAAIPPVAGMLALPLLLAITLRADADGSGTQAAGSDTAEHDRDDDGRQQQRSHVPT